MFYIKYETKKVSDYGHFRSVLDFRKSCHDSQKKEYLNVINI